MAAVNIIDISKHYGKELALDKVNLSIEKGEFVAVVGPSGCGKSTLLRMVAGLEKITSGSVLINNQCVNTIPPAQRDMAMVFQSYALYPHMSVYQNMAYGLKMRGMSKKDIRERLEAVAAMLKLSDYVDRKPSALSGGQRQRVAMGRALVRSPAVFLFDEPLSNLDSKLRTEMRLEIKKLHQQLRFTCLYVTHDQTEAMTMASRVLVLNKGKVEQIATPTILYQQPASIFVAEITGHYPMNFLPCQLSLEQNKVFNQEFNLEFPLPKGLLKIDCPEVVLGIRPEHFVLCDVLTPGAIAVNVVFIDDLGADKLLHVQSANGAHRFRIRIAADHEFKNEMTIKPIIHKANLYSQHTGLRLGGWE